MQCRKFGAWHMEKNHTSGRCGKCYYSGGVKLDDVKEVGTYLTGIFPLLFVPAAAGVMELWAEMGNMLLPIIIAIIPVTVLVMVSAGRTTQAMTGRKKKEADHAE